MAQILDEARVKLEAQKMINQQKTADKEIDTTIDEVLQAIPQTKIGEDDTYDFIVKLLSLPEDKFAILAPLFISQIEDSYNQPDTKLLLVKLYNAQGLKAEELQEEYENFCEYVDQTEGMSQQKKDFIKEVVGLSANATAGCEGINKKFINVPIEFMSSEVRKPEYAHLTDSGMDIFALEEITIAPGETKLIHTGIKLAIPNGYEVQIRPKSGRCLKTKLRIANTPATIDAGYRGEICVIVENVDPPIRAIHPSGKIITIGDIEFGQSYTIGKGEKFAQLVLCEIPKMILIPVGTVEGIGTDRNGGFGSTGLK